MTKKSNRLATEKSPYLLQHAYNPVEWYPWGEEAFEIARHTDKPIFLSIGYSTCYWCHVMEREVFENEQLAGLMNNFAVNIKVDREERPDVDRIYMKAVQAMTGSGGWPMSVFLTHDLKPFYAATYIPPVSQYGRPGFGDVLNSIHTLWVNDREKILSTSEQVYDHLHKHSAPAFDSLEPTADTLDAGFKSFSDSFDSLNKGFGGPPKFPTPVSFTFLLRYYARTGNRRALYMTLETLQTMARGGIYDHIGGGFHRYATDEHWHVPHFEKMLYDQAQLALAYLEAYQITKEDLYRNTAIDILSYVSRVFEHPDGGFYSAEDAESAIRIEEPEIKREGAFYTWTETEIDALLDDQKRKTATYYYGLEEGGNVLTDPHGIFAGHNILHIVASIDQTSDAIGMSADETRTVLRNIRKKLFEAREKRPHPHLDDKILLSWNGLMISAYARASTVLSADSYLDTARRAARFILDRLYNVEKDILLRRFRDGEARFDAHLEDYAFLIQGLIDLYEGSFELDWLRKANEFTRTMIAKFYDETNGGFFDTSDTDPSVILRTKEWYDGAEPSGNAIAILNLLRLGNMLNRSEYIDIARKSISALGTVIEKAPMAVAQLLAAVEFDMVKPTQIIITGDKDTDTFGEMIQEIHSRFGPNKVLMHIYSDEAREYFTRHNDFIRSLKIDRNQITVYVCENFTCKLPVTAPEELRVLISGNSG
jgi:uncharacterized protein